MVPSSQKQAFSELISPLEIFLKEEIIEPFLLESDKGDTEAEPQEGLQDAFDKRTPDVFMPKEQKN